MIRLSEINFTLLLPASLVFMLLVFHCYLYRGGRLTLTFFGGAFLHALTKELAHIYLEYKTASRAYRMLGIGLQIFHLPLVVYMGWAITFYLSWYLAEKILKRIGSFSDRIFPTIVWSIIVAGAISYCVEATAIRAGWWLWSFPDFRLKDFLVAPFSALEAWPSQAAHFLLIFFLAECSKYRKQWWRVFLYTFIIWMAIFATFTFTLINSWRFTPIIRVYDSIRILLPIILMFFSPLQLKFIRLDSIASRRNTFLYDVLPLFASVFLLFTCMIVDTLILKEPELLISILSLVLVIMLSIKKIPLSLIFILLALLLIRGDKRLFVSYIPMIVFLMFMAYRKIGKIGKKGQILIQTK